MASAPADSPARPKAPYFWGSLGAALVLDFVTKALAVRNLEEHLPRGVVGEYLRFTLAYNPGAAFSMHLGPASRWIFGTLAVVAVVILGRMYREAEPTDRLRALALGLVCGGALGNLLDRLQPAREGVVDFIDVGLSPWTRFYTFNVADSAVTVGALLLAWVLWTEGAPASAAEPVRHGDVPEGQEG